MSDCYLYVIGRLEGPVKIGVSSAPYERVAVLQTGCPFPIRLLHAVKYEDRRSAFRDEQKFHSVWKECRLAGEWFDLDAQHAYDGISADFDIDEYDRVWP